MITLQDVLVLGELVQAALPRLDFDNPNQAQFGNELLRLINHVGAIYEWGRVNLKTSPEPLTVKGKCGTIDVYKYTEGKG